MRAYGGRPCLHLLLRAAAVLLEVAAARHRALGGLAPLDVHLQQRPHLQAQRAPAAGLELG